MGGKSNEIQEVKKRSRVRGRRKDRQLLIQKDTRTGRGEDDDRHPKPKGTRRKQTQKQKRNVHEPSIILSFTIY